MNEKNIQKLEFPKIREKVAAYAVSSPGKEEILKLMPFTSKTEILRALQETNEAKSLLDEKGGAPFEGVYDVLGTLNYIGKGGTASIDGLIKTANILKSARLLKDYVGKDEKTGALQELTAGVTSLKNLENAIYQAITDENEIADHASDALLRIRRALREKTASVKDKIQGMVRENEKYLQDAIYTVRGDRYVIPVKAEHKSQVKGLVHDQSASGATLFIEPMGLVNLNNEIKELMLKEKAEVERILMELSQKVDKDLPFVKTNADIVYALDVIFAKAKYSIRTDGTIPALMDNLTFNLRDARHPLIPDKVVVPSTIYMEEGITAIIITGPNTGGKTVTLKTVGLLHIMAMSGILIPVTDGSSIGHYSSIYADIGDEQSIEQSLSTFSSHMVNIVHIIEEADERALVLFDELGAGTDPTEGAALAMAILETLKERGLHIMATTHYSELKAYALKSDKTTNASVEFNVETLRPTYRLLIGVPGKSNAFLISKRLGLPQEFIERSRAYIDKEALRFEELIESLEKSRRDASKDARFAENIKNELKRKEEELEKKLQRIEEIREKALGEARQEGKKYLQEAKEKADVLLKQLREIEQNVDLKDSRRSLQSLRDTLKKDLEKGEQKELFERVEGEKVTEFKEGQEVLLSTLNQKVSILSLPDAKGDLMVQAGIMKLSVNKKDLVVLKEDKKQRKFEKREARLNLRSVSTSCDVRGSDALEAERAVDYYLDEASMTGLLEVTIIHGMGTGILKEHLWDMFRHHPHVKKYRLGEYGEGGKGVTIVTLK
ncbi:endonuclease MutS2 [Proteiniclasticum ruminis]|uniref:Endonuclease MutS2 n=1 Tax=Proteiniclasticum ruminis TaxID=398199 RepID=A0A1I4Y0F6_9CLOT|nr:endonuclease MutS2 [Proteiniclasticum ruminis]SFN31618.1 DNA mismatch repair protein MutS2 [Proteiniclasticum ruminis]